MALYFKDIEITKLRDLAPQTGLDITDIWFGNTNVYTVWQVYEGTLPTTLNANGDNMKQYQVWGAAGGVGEPTENLFDKNAKEVIKGYVVNAMITSDGATIGNNNFYISEYIALKPANSYKWKWISAISQATAASLTIYDTNKNAIATLVYQSNAIITIPSGAYYCRLSVHKKYADISMLIKGTTPPETYVPYGYKLDMATGSNILQSSEIEQGGWYASAGMVPEKVVHFARCRSKNIYTISSKKIFYDSKLLNVNTVFIDSNGVSLGGSGFKSGVGSVDVPENAVKCSFIIANTDTSANITPAQVIAAGIWASVDATTTPIYIGDDPLDKDEYIDYQAGKIYRQTENKYDILTQFYGEGLNNNGNITKPSLISSRSDYISVAQNTPYTKKSNISDGRSRLTQFFDENETFIAQASSSENPTTFTTPNNCAFVRISYPIDSTQVMLVEGSDAPAQFIPYLQSTDPPVPLPALPTCEGTTIVDYAGSGTTPEKVLLKYRKEGY